MSFGARFLGVDWGTTNRRVFLIEDGETIRVQRDGKGVTSVTDFSAEITMIRAAFGDLPMLMAGMVGSNIGWRPAPYVPAPAGVADLVSGVLRIDARTLITPGVSVSHPADVMRGEEVQLLGAIEAGLVPPEALLVQPGTHCKWAELADARIVGFTTAMTGELFALLRHQGLLAAQLAGDVTPGDAFLAGVDEGARRDLTASLFGIRAAKLLGQRDNRDAASFASGLLIGSDAAVRLDHARHTMVHILADAELGGLYAAAIERLGRATRVIDSQAAFAAGISAIGAQL